jgi:hypothetical protein
MSSDKEHEDGLVSSPTQVHLTKSEKYTNVNDDDDVPDLILPPGPPSSIAMPSKESSENRGGHPRDDVSIETTISQSMDLSSFIKTLELQQQEEQTQHDLKKTAQERSVVGGDSPRSASLSLAASQVDISLANEAEDIQAEINDNDKSDCKICSTSTKNSNETAARKSNYDDITDPAGLEESPEALKVDRSSATIKGSSHDRNTLVHVGEQLYRESLEAGSAKSNKKETQKVIDRDISDKAPPKGTSATKMVTKTVKFMVFIVAIVAFVFGGDESVQPSNVNPGVQYDSPSPKTESERVSVEGTVDVDQNNPLLNESSSDPQVEPKNQNDDGLPNASKIFFDTSENTLLHDSLDQAREERTNDYNDEQHNPSEAGDDGSKGWIRLIVALLFVAHQLFFFLRSTFFSSSSLSKEKVKMEVTTPATPTGASSRRNRDSFLTPPLSSKNRAQEPTEWMSPCYGENALDVSAYKVMKAIELREFLRERKCDTRGTKEKMIKMLIQSYQMELACLTVQQLRPKLRRRNLSQKGTKKDIVRRLVEAGPNVPKNARLHHQSLDQVDPSSTGLGMPVDL